MKPIIVFLASVLAFSPDLYAETASRNTEAANVIRVDEGCTIGWIGCPLADAVQLPDGSYDCPLAAIRLVPITGDRTSVEASNAGGRVIWHCQAQIAFGQLNLLGVDGSLGQIVAARPETVCLLFPAACRGDGAVIANEATVDGAARCAVNGTVTTALQSQITPSGQANLMCFLPSEGGPHDFLSGSPSGQEAPPAKPMLWGNIKKIYQ